MSATTKKTITVSVLFLLGSSVLTSLAWAQCAPGVPSAGNPGCIPQDRPESPYFRGNPDQLSQQAAQPRAIWSDRWGAIVVDDHNGKAGASNGQPTKSKAVEIATQQCIESGGLHCKLAFDYHNQCVAVANGSESAGYGAAATQDGSDLLAMKECSHSECKVVYRACSFPERIQ